MQEPHVSGATLADLPRRHDRIRLIEKVTIRLGDGDTHTYPEGSTGTFLGFPKHDAQQVTARVRLDNPEWEGIIVHRKIRKLSEDAKTGSS